MTAKITSFPDATGVGASRPAAETIAGYDRLAGEIFQHLRDLSADGPGITRPSYGDAEEKALRYIAGLAEAEGLSVRWDEAANLVVTLDGQHAERPAVSVGSHLDSVPIGGNFDGAAGVIAGLISLIHMKRSATLPPRTVRLYGFRGEESAWFGTCYIGSKALFGELTAEDLKSKHRQTGDALESYMAKAGAEVAAIASGRKFVRAENIASFIELHIEQGPVLVDRKLPVGIVTGIRGNIRHQTVVCRGEAGHSGAVPRWLRHDAVMAVSDLLVRLDEHWRVLLERGIDLVITSGIVTTDPAHHAEKEKWNHQTVGRVDLPALAHLRAPDARGRQGKGQECFEEIIIARPKKLGDRQRNKTAIKERTLGYLFTHAANILNAKPTCTLIDSLKGFID